MHWLQGVLAFLSAVAAWRWVVRPLRRGWREAVSVLRQIRDSSQGVQQLALEVRGLSGSVIRLVVALVEEHQELRAEHQALRERMGDHTELLVDLQADVRRLEKRRETDEPS